MPLRETLDHAGYHHVRLLSPGVHALQSVNTIEGIIPSIEVWYARKYAPASYAIIYRDVFLEFGYSMKEEEARNLKLI